MAKTRRRNTQRKSSRKPSSTRRNKPMKWLDFVKMTHKNCKGRSQWTFSKSLKEAGKNWKQYKKGGMGGVLKGGDGEKSMVDATEKSLNGIPPHVASPPVVPAPVVPPSVGSSSP